MLPAERYEKIKQYIYENKYANINELAEKFHTSTPTIRRCLKQLEEERFVESVRGGAVLASNGSVVELPYLVKRQQHAEEKSRIARAASNYIKSGNSIFLDSSSTVYEMVRHLSNYSNLSISTNDVLIAGALTSQPDCTVMVIGGILRPGYNTLMGYFAENIMQQMHVDYAFVSVDTVTANGDFMITNSDEVGIKQSIINNADFKIALCDHSKFLRSAFINLWGAESVDLVITGTELDDKTYQHYKDLGMNIIRV